MNKKKKKHEKFAEQNQQRFSTDQDQVLVLQLSCNYTQKTQTTFITKMRFSKIPITQQATKKGETDGVHVTSQKLSLQSPENSQNDLNND